MNKLIVFFLLTILLTACGPWSVTPQPFPVWTPIPSRTPGIVTATPIILIPTVTFSPVPQIATVTPTTPTSSADTSPTFSPTVSVTAAVTDTETPSPSPSPTATLIPIQAIQVVIIGCNTGIDILHGMGEETNAYVTLQNTGTVDLPNACGLLRAADEGRPHPDKTKCVDNLPAGYQVTLKLTVDTTFKKDTIIQVDASSDGNLLLRVDKQSCTDLDVVGGIPTDIGEIKPTTP